MPIQLHCKSCGVEFVPTKREIMRGPQVYRYCPDCRTPPATSSLPLAEPVPARC